ncbi:MAG: hypothetical protein WEF53_04035 [Bacteroidota bacterium]
MQSIHLRIVGRKSGDGFFAICLETDIAVQGHSLAEVERKMRDALLVYLKSFDVDEIMRGEFIRKAPLIHRARWNVIMLLGFMTRAWDTITFSGDYDPTSRRLNLA